MENIEWWPKLDSAAKEWLVAHNGEAVAPDIVAQIEAAGGSVTSDEWRVGENGPDGYYLSDEAVDWIETTANDESA